MTPAKVDRYTFRRPLQPLDDRYDRYDRYTRLHTVYWPAAAPDTGRPTDLRIYPVTWYAYRLYGCMQRLFQSL